MRIDGSEWGRGGGLRVLQGQRGHRHPANCPEGGGAAGEKADRWHWAVLGEECLPGFASFTPCHCSAHISGSPVTP